ncbi:MAG: hypothetical protein ABSD98_06635 [Candidatus Korobacteraceae bacterium]|jgi:hypothetical protein
MNDARWPLRRSVRNCYLAPSLLLAIFAVAAVAQENIRPSQSQQIEVAVSERLPPRGRKVACGKLPGSVYLAITNYLPRRVAAIVESGGVDLLSVAIAANEGRPYGHALPSIANLCVPPGEYAIHLHDPTQEYLPDHAHVQAQPSRIYDIDVVSPEVSELLAAWDERASAAGQSTTSTSASISAQIDRIANGAHQDLPAPVQTPIARGQNPGWSIENATGYQLHLYLSGPAERDYVIPNGNSINVDLPPGTYRIAADVSNKAVIPFYAVRQLNANARWTSHFYIGRE